MLLMTPLSREAHLRTFIAALSEVAKCRKPPGCPWRWSTAFRPVFTTVCLQLLQKMRETHMHRLPGLVKMRI